MARWKLFRRRRAVIIRMTNNGNLGNRMFQYAYCRRLQELVPGSQLTGFDIPEFGLLGEDIDPQGRVLRITEGQRHSLTDIAHQLNSFAYDGLVFGAYVMRLEYYPSRAQFAALFPQRIEVDRAHLGPGNLTINIRGGDILATPHPDYNPVPVSFYEYLAETTKLDPVIMGQLGDDPYSEALRQRFSGCVFLPCNSSEQDFAIVRNSRNIAVSVSTFSWLAAWLSDTAVAIHLPVSGMFNPKQRPDIDLLPVGDARYSFYEFPVYKWTASAEQFAALVGAARGFWVEEGKASF